MHERLVEQLGSELRRRGHLNRRQFLQLATAVAGGELVVSQLGPLRRALASAGGGGNRSDGVVLVIYMGGGNDGLNTVVPVTDNKYFDLRRDLALDPAQCHMLTPDTALHPRLSALAARYANGDVAVIRNVGYVPPNLSHFTSQDQWSAGAGSGGNILASPRSGWLGRWADTQGAPDLFRSMAFGSAVPLHIRSETTQPLALPLSQSNSLGSKPTDTNEARLYRAFRSMSPGVTGTGRLGDRLAVMNGRAIDAATIAEPAWTSLDGTNLRRQLLMAANVVNAGIGVRVMAASYGGFDTHSNQAVGHADLLGDLDLSLEAFFGRLSPSMASKVTVMTFSEFGRRAEVNDSLGTDHGTSSCMFVVGNGVRGGVYGDAPPLTNLDNNGNLRPTLDFRRVYSSILSGWLGSDPDAIIGAPHADMRLFSADVGATTTTSTTTTSTSSTSTSTSTTSTIVASTSTIAATTIAPSTTASPTTSTVPGTEPTSTTAPSTTAPSTTPSSTAAPSTTVVSTTTEPATTVAPVPATTTAAPAPVAATPTVEQQLATTTSTLSPTTSTTRPSVPKRTIPGPVFVERDPQLQSAPIAGEPPPGFDPPASEPTTTTEPDPIVVAATLPTPPPAGEAGTSTTTQPITGTTRRDPKSKAPKALALTPVAPPKKQKVAKKATPKPKRVTVKVGRRGGSATAKKP